VTSGYDTDRMAVLVQGVGRLQHPRTRRQVPGRHNRHTHGIAIDIYYPA
jgi:hypothetical protein